MFTMKSASRGLAAVVVLGMVACGGAKDGGETAGQDTSTAMAPAATTAMNGETEYTNTCSACHQADGNGMAGQFPPLAGSDIANMASPDRMIAIVLKGLNGPVTVKGAEYNGAMAAWESVLDDEKIAAILTYERSSWGNAASAVTAEQVAAMRTKVADRTMPWTIAELEKAVP